MAEASLQTVMDWTPIGATSNQLILYHPPSHALSVQPHPSLQSQAGPSITRRTPLLLPYRAITPLPLETISTSTSAALCPYCSQPFPVPLEDGAEADDPVRPKGYFQILERAHEGSRPPSPGFSSPRRRDRTPTPTPMSMPAEADEVLGDQEDLPARGYYDRFFREEGRLGIGAEGSVYLATHVIGGNVLGTYAVKKIAVGTSSSYLVKMLREVRLLEALRHPNIIAYHHSWIEPTRFSSFGPSILALHILMMYATAGNLDSFLLTRAHSPRPDCPDLSAGNLPDAESLGQLPREERIKAFKKRRQSSSVAAMNGDGKLGEGGRRRKEENRGVMMLGFDEVMKLFGDVVEGLAFLHANSILHLDLKCSNVLLHWEEGKLTPKAMISDFGTSEEMLRGKRDRTGHTGTMEYMAPETLETNQNGMWRPSDSYADMWSLGMILHKLLFLRLPYRDTDDFDSLRNQILEYPGYFPTSEQIHSASRRHLPRDFLTLLSKLVHRVPEQRPAAEKVRLGLRSVLPDLTGGSSKWHLVKRFSGRLFTPPPATVVPTRSQPSRLALPSPEDEAREPSFASDDSALRVAGRGRLVARKVLSGQTIRVAVCVIKILSVQPSMVPRAQKLGPLALLFLVFLAVFDLQVGTWQMDVAAATIHLGVFAALG